MKKATNLPRHPVAAGSHVVSGEKRAILEAYLGTCVGVSLCDRDARVGGLIHLLLSEPTGIERPWHPGNYATTGLPVFIKEVCERGARKERLEACIAGGALVGPLSEKDLNLDIGGRTVEAVEEILRRDTIKVSNSETGGYFTCCLRLNLETWESTIQPIGSQTTCKERLDKKPTIEELDRAVQRVRPIPQVALKIIRMIQDQKHNMQDVAREIRLDQVIGASVIRLCNSALFGLRERVDSIDRALVLLGEKKLLQLVISASLENFFPESDNGYSLCKGGLYKHALGAAILAERLAAFTGRVPGDVAYTAGLLHDIGKVVLDQYIAPKYPLFYRRTQVGVDNLIVVEDEVIGVSHPEAGSRLAEHWSLPESLIDAIRYHHNPEEAIMSPELTHLIYLADLLLSRFLVGQELERLNTDAFAQRLSTVGFNLSQLPIIIDLIPERVFQASM